MSFLLALLVAAGAHFQVGARVVSSASVSAQVRGGQVQLSTRGAPAGRVLVGEPTPSGEVVVTLLY